MSRSKGGGVKALSMTDIGNSALLLDLFSSDGMCAMAAVCSGGPSTGSNGCP